MAHPRRIRSRWELRPVVATLEAAPGTRVRFLVEATNWGPAAGKVHLLARSEWSVQIQPAEPELAPGHIHLAAVRVEVPEDAGVGERMAIQVVLHGAARPVACDLEVVVAGDRASRVPVVAFRPSPSRAPAARHGRL